MKTQRPIPSEEEHRVLEFRPRASSPPPGQRVNLVEQSSREQPWRGEAQPKDRQAANDLSRYERERDDRPDDFRHRMLANVAAFAFTVALTAVGLWLAMSIADLRRTQDCVLEGRRDCARISSPRI